MHIYIFRSKRIRFIIIPKGGVENRFLCKQPRGEYHLKNRNLTSTVSWMTCFFLIFTLVFPASVFAGKNRPDISYRESIQKQGNKISSRVLQQFNKNKVVTFLIKLKDQVDADKVVRSMQKRVNSQHITPYKADLLKRSAIVSNLRSTAISTQEPLLQYLEKKKKAGSVTSYHSYYIVNALAVTGTKEVVNELSTRPEIAKILPNEKRKLIGQLAVVSKKKKPPRKKGAPQAIEWGIQRVNAPQVWNMGINGAGIVIANIDTGVQWDHPALKEKYRGYNSSNPDQPDNTFNWYDAVTNQPTPYDDLSHGTHTMGTMVGSESNGSNQIGVAPGAKWIAVKAFSSKGGSDADLLKAGEWIIAPKDAQGNPHPEKAPNVVNNSWGGGPGLDEWYRPMVKNWRAANIFPEFSAGNTTWSNPGGTGSVANPANYPESFATGATDSSNKLASFSLQGPSPYKELKPEVSAPGVNIRSSVPGSKYEGGWNGTSMAGPHVSAVVALLKQANASLTVDQIEDILTSTATPLTDSTFPTSPNNGYGHGLVNAFDAVSSVLNGIGEINGHVTKPGTDKEKPTWTHSSVEVAFKGTPINLTLTAKDNISVTNVKVHYRSNNSEWKSLDATRTIGDYRNGTYQVKIPKADTLPTQLTYYMEINDFGNNKVTTPEYKVTIIPGLTKGHSNDFEFEDSQSGWSSFGTNNLWKCGKPTVGPEKAFSGDYVFGSNLHEKYKNNTDATLVMPPIDVSEGKTFLQFKQWYDIESGYDFGNVLVSTDLEKWTKLTSVTGSSKAWVDGEVDLSSYAGSTIYVGFNLKTDNVTTKTGWYIDNIAITDTSLNGENKSTDSLKKPTMKKSFTFTRTTHKSAKLPNQITGLPMEAKVSVLETGRSVTTSPSDGSYILRHPSGSFTLRAEAYGFKSSDAKLTLAKDGTATQDFTLEALPTSTIHGKISNKATGKPIAGATLLLVEDAVVTPVKTDSDGNYSIEAYEGAYTLRILAPRYYSQDTPITVKGNDPLEHNLSLKPFIGYDGEIKYDDGSPENAHVFYEAGNSWAVRMSLDSDKSKVALVQSGMFRFWNTEWPTPGGTDFEVAIYDSSGPDGSPGKKLGGPFKATALRNGDWTEVDLSDKSVFVSGDFYMAYIQSQANPNAPGLTADENSKNAERSWQLVGGKWTPVPIKDGNYLIRAKVSYEVTTPQIDTSLHQKYTNQPTIEITGKATPSVQVKLHKNGVEAALGTAKQDGSFSIPVTLNKGENLITATSTTSDGSTDPCEPAKIILDQTKPTISIHSPSNGRKTNHETITITGQATDKYMDCVKINGKKTTLDKNGHYYLRTMLHLGLNKLTVKAYDKAGNESSQTITIDANFLPIKIHDFAPTKNLNLQTGDTVKISFTSFANLKGTFTVKVPLTSMKSNVINLPLTEVVDGKYVAYWTVPKTLINIRGAVIEVFVKDNYGNTLHQTAPGKLNINIKKQK